MGKVAKGSRKGKKAWRANIKTEDIEEYFEKTTKDAHSGVSSTITSLPSESLFYVDKSTDVPVKRKIEKHRLKVLRHESLLQRNLFVQPVPSSILKKCKERKEIKSVKAEVRDVSKTQDPALQLDLWNNEGEENAKAKKKSATSLIPAVEMEPPGCSFNPPFEAHQDSLAEAVADEMQKIYREELGPEPVPLIVPGEIILEEDKYFLDADDDNESDAEDQDNANDELLARRKSKTKKVTRVELNRRAKLKKHMKAEAEAKKRDDMSKQIDCLSDIIKEIAKEDEEKNSRHLRRVIAKHENLKVRPPRLGKHKFVPASKQVLLTEEISGSIRKLKGCCTLARDRFKSLEKRGLLVPTANGRRRRRR
ncbi:uncharacterized protein At2g40430 isoform X2 [Phalaenopsis equestris]|uniref:uncharacterized protein At2g40430 isoform X2 n=1 Tax=Phalaenopsis equestris TaxID=78828 RepID=UPI0009E4E177|nr:uncharacterized protein At2g40430 isoform X2 [Phalaenopsis equestris]